MTRAYIKSVTWDCEDTIEVATFWAAALGSEVDEDSTPDKAFLEAPGWGGPNMWFVKVPESKSSKNRVHLDLRAPSSKTRLSASPNWEPRCSDITSTSS